jgi:predicted Zn finger-like uncharacterized protein
MSALEPIRFKCPGCGAKYKVVSIKPPPFEAKDIKVKCRRCGFPFPATDGDALLKYFLVTRRSLN